MSETKDSIATEDDATEPVCVGHGYVDGIYGCIIESRPRKHRFNGRIFCDNCGADAIGLQGRGKDAMVCRG